MAPFVILLIALLVIASFLRGDFALTLLYLVLGALAAATWWSRHSMSQVLARRQFNNHAFLGEKIQIDLRVQNKGWLPIPWLELHETLPVALAGPNSFQSVIHLGPGAEASFEYAVDARKRGSYLIGPLSVSTGDIMGLTAGVLAQSPAESLIIYPKIVPFTSMEIPSRSPQGTLRHNLPLFEDPTRVFGKRGYQSGDSLRRIDWKSSASSGRLQVKLFEPSIALETFIVLNLNSDDYYYRTRFDAVELAIVIAASVCNWIIGKKQMVGMMVNGRDALSEDGRPQTISPHKGKRHLMRLLETLARAETVDQPALLPLLQQQRYRLTWGTTLIVITGGISNELLDELYQARRNGQNPFVIVSGTDISDDALYRRAKILKLPVYNIPTERDLKIWMQEAGHS
jgi:uncharacterized protein (DUF58 family)